VIQAPIAMDVPGVEECGNKTSPSGSPHPQVLSSLPCY
jgi:hypothetical protein